MADSLAQALLAKLGVNIPQAPAVTPEQERLHQEMVRREQAKQGGLRTAAQRLITAPAEAVMGAFYDPTQKMSDEERNPAFGLGAMGATLPFAPKGIKGLYSRVEKIAESLPDQINPNKLQSIFKNRASQEELQWRGVDRLLAEKGNQPVMKDELVRHLEQNPLDVSVVEKSPEGLVDKRGYNAGSRTSYDNYQMPGATNYRETLIQLPVESDPATGANINPIFTGHHWDEPNLLVHVRHNERRLPPMQETGKEFFYGPANQRMEARVTDETRPQLQEIMPEGWRMEKETQPAGPLGRMLENVQSDWHQRGAHSGYREALDAPPGMAQDVAAYDARNNLSRINDEILTEMGTIPQEYRLRTSDEWDVEEMSHNIDAWARFYRQQFPQIAPLADQLQQARVAYDNANDMAQRAVGAVPDAPFKDSWAELALKQQLLDIAHNRPDLEWIGIAPSSELRSRGEVISPEFQDVQLPRTLEKLVKPFGGQVEQANLGIHQPFFNPVGQYGTSKPIGEPNVIEVQRYLHGSDENPARVASVWPRRDPGYNPDKGASELIKLLQQNRPDLLQSGPTAPIARLTPEILAAIREKGFPLIMALLALQQQQQGQR